jgi:hypothetical protein
MFMLYGSNLGGSSTKSGFQIIGGVGIMALIRFKTASNIHMCTVSRMVLGVYLATDRIHFYFLLFQTFLGHLHLFGLAIPAYPVTHILAAEKANLFPPATVQIRAYPSLESEN